MMPSHTIRQLKGGALDCLVYGMTWEHVGGASPERRSAQRVKARKATHYIAAHEGSSVVGLARIHGNLQRTGTKPKKGSQRRYYSAGVLFAMQRPEGVYVSSLNLQEDGIWLIASHDGAVIPGYDVVVDDAGKVQEALQLLQERYDGAQLVDVQELNLTEAKSAPYARLIEVKTSTQSIPNWIKIAAAVIVVYGVYTEGLAQWDEYQADKVQVPTQQFDYNLERSKQLDTWQGTIHTDTVEELQTVLIRIGELPLAFGGWSLVSNECLPKPGEWVCSADYKLINGGSNVTFKSLAPTSCQVKFVDLLKAQLLCRIPVHRKTLNRLDVEEPDVINLDFIARVQSILPVFSEVTVSLKTKVDVPNLVVTNDQGNRITLTPVGPETPQTHVPGKQTFSYVGPMRSLTVMPMSNFSVIDKITITVRDLTEPTFNTSAIRAELSGVMYVQ